MSRMSPESLLDPLNGLLAGLEKPALRAHGLVRQRVGWVLLLVSTSATAVQETISLADDASVRALLTGWCDDDLFVYALGDRWDNSVLTLVVHERELMRVSNALAAPTHAPSPPPASEVAPHPADHGPSWGSGRATLRRTDNRRALAAWFEALVKAPLPISLDLVPLGEHLWGSAKTRGREPYGRRWLPRISRLRDYTLFGFAGYGSNSYAVFLTRRRGDTEMMLRLSWGGAFGNSERSRLGLLATLSEANRLFELAASKHLPMHFCIDMDVFRFDVQPIPDGLPLGQANVPEGSFEALRAYVGM